jgi:hypothetical protein
MVGDTRFSGRPWKRLPLATRKKSRILPGLRPPFERKIDRVITFTGRGHPYDSLFECGLELADLTPAIMGGSRPLPARMPIGNRGHLAALMKRLEYTINGPEGCRRSGVTGA